MGKPKIRFKGYTDEWEQRKFGEITELKSASRVHKDEWTSNGVPFYRSSDVMVAINGTENEKAFISEELYEKLSKVSGKLEEGDILVTGGGSVGNPYIVPDNKPLYTKDADLLWIKNKGKFHPYFLYEFFFSPTFRNYLGSISHVGTIAHYTITQLSDTPICLPSSEEQKEVGEYFQSLDHLITLHQRKCNETKKLKKYMLQKMFPQNGEKVPEVRFSGFTDDWEQRKVLDLLVQPVTDGPHETPRLVENGIPFISVDAIVDNKIDFSRKRGDISEEYDAECCKKYKPQYHDVYVVKSGSTVGKVAIVETTDRFNIWSPLAALRCEGKTNPYYLFYLLQTRRMQAQISDKASNGTQPNLSMRELEKFDVLVTDNAEEQQRIGDYFKSLDTLITLHQQKCDELRDVKKYMLQNMFI